MREVLVLWAGRHRRREWDELCGHFRERIAHAWTIREQLVKPRGRTDDASRRAAEADAMRAALPDPAWTVALDPRGRQRSSEEFARRLSRRREEWPHPIVFLVGSDLGLDPELVAECRERLSFGPMVFGHELARLVLYEQLYRAVAIESGIKYHRPPP